MKYSLSIRRIYIREKHRLPLAVILSVMLHVLFLIFGRYGIIDLKQPVALTALPVVEDRRLVFEIVESNPEAEIPLPEDDAQYASDRNARAQDMNPETDPFAVRPKTDGVIDSKEIPRPPASSKQLEITNPFVPFKQFVPPDLNFGKLNLQRENEKESEQKNQKTAESAKNAFADNKRFSVQDFGGLSLSTYKWNFAPYLLELKRKIERNLRPPTQFYMGLLQGSYKIHFVIERDGKVSKISILESNGSKRLELTSYNSIQFSSPFKPLPGDFPDKVLEVTGLFKFHIIK